MPEGKARVSPCSSSRVICVISISFGKFHLRLHRFNEPAIGPVRLDHFLVGAALHHFTTFQDDNFIGIADRAEAVSHNQAGDAAPAQAVIHVFFAVGIERTGGFIENENARVVDQRAGDLQALPLARRSGSARPPPP